LLIAGYWAGLGSPDSSLLDAAGAALTVAIAVEQRGHFLAVIARILARQLQDPATDPPLSDNLSHRAITRAPSVIVLRSAGRQGVLTMAPSVFLDQWTPNLDHLARPIANDTVSASYRPWAW
jgi:hypothetical protein